MRLSDYLKVKDIDKYNTYSKNKFISSLLSNIEIGKRDKNSKRDFLFINKYQGKHKPVEPSKIKELIALLIDKLIYQSGIAFTGDKIVVIGMAETSLLLSELISESLLGRYKEVINAQTTRRQDLLKDNSIHITEKHSHNTDLILNTDTINILNNSIDIPIVIVDDEITTGNTIKSLISNTNKVIDLSKHNIYSLSVLNWTGKEGDKADNIAYQYVSLINTEIDFTDIFSNKQVPTTKHIISYSVNEFLYKYQEELRAYKDIQVIGVEEDMYTAFKLADLLEEKLHKKVKYRATTRSPIKVYGGIFNKHIITSPYTLINESTSNSYIYNLTEADTYIVVINKIDNKSKQSKFFNEISKILSEYTNNVYLVTINR